MCDMDLRVTISKRTNGGYKGAFIRIFPGRLSYHTKLEPTLREKRAERMRIKQFPCAKDLRFAKDQHMMG